MPTYLKIIIAFVVLAGIAFVLDSLLIKYQASKLISTEYDFRQAKWGMGPEEVKASESLELDEELSGGEYLYYETDTIAGFKAYITYYFKDGQLIHGYTYFNEGGLNPNIGNYEIDKIKDYLTTEYGPPIDDFKFDLDDDVVRSIDWKTKSTEIYLLITEHECEERHCDNRAEYEVILMYEKMNAESMLDRITDSFSAILVGINLVLDPLYN